VEHVAYLNDETRIEAPFGHGAKEGLVKVEVLLRNPLELSETEAAYLLLPQNGIVRLVRPRPPVIESTKPAAISLTRST
jgi:hypothetical protein